MAVRKVCGDPVAVHSPVGKPMNVLSFHGVRSLHDPVTQQAGDALFHILKSLHRFQGVQIIAAEIFGDFEQNRDSGGEPVVGCSGAVAIAPLGQKNRHVGEAGLGQFE